MECPDNNEIAVLVAGRLDEAAIAGLQAHLDSCSRCFELVAELARGDEVAETAGADAPTATWRASRHLDEYRMIRPVGRGSGGQVWLAHDSLLDREVAIKLLSAASHPRARERFRVEVRAVARLNHPNVVTVFRVGEVDGQPYLVSELVRGESLDTIAKPLPWERVRQIGIGLARGLAAAHRAGIIHRDIKPGNAVVGADGEVKLLDFGLAKLHDADDLRGDGVSSSVSGTAAGQILGTPLYMAPEAWEGRAPACAMDVFSLGALMYELCCGEPPHAGATIAALRTAALVEPVRPLATRVIGIDPAFAAVIDRCLARLPADRYPSGAELQVALEATLRRRRPHRRLALVAALVVICGVAVPALRHRTDAPPRVQIAAPQRCSFDRWCWDAGWVGSLNSVWGAAANDVWIVGERGVVRHFVEGVWRDIEVGSVADFYRLGGTATDDVWIVGGWGTILHWDGHAWRELPSGTHVALYGIWAVARDNAWVTGEGGTILHWDGHAWNSQASPTTAALFAVAGVAADDVWITGYGVGLHWDGQAWTLSDLHSHELMQPIHAASTNDVWVAGFHSVIRHWNGREWTMVPVPAVAVKRADELADVPFNSGAGVGEGELWLVRKHGGFLHLVGNTWTRVEQGTTNELFAMHAFASDDAWAVGAGGAVVHWDGHAWRQIGPDRPWRSAHGLWARSPRDVWTVGKDERGHGRARHFDGREWIDLPVPDDVPELTSVTGDRDEVVAVGVRGTVVRWHEGSLAVERAGAANLTSVWLDAPGRAWAVGDDGAIMRFSDREWRAVSGGSGALLGVWGAKPGEAWAVGARGLFHLQGETWTHVESGTTEMLGAVWGTASDNVWAVGAHGTIVHFDGVTWTSVFSDFDQPLDAISGSRRDDVWAVSNSDQGGASIIHYNGSFWTRIDRTPHMPLTAIYAVGLDEAWAAGPWDSYLHHVPI
ncbi:MAG TPA: protein kinase [Kofleriaceae bacterium]|nr:protein kinase [Kofleriaceae bacterium]